MPNFFFTYTKELLNKPFIYLGFERNEILVKQTEVLSVRQQPDLDDDNIDNLLPLSEILEQLHQFGRKQSWRVRHKLNEKTYRARINILRCVFIVCFLSSLMDKSEEKTVPSTVVNFGVSGNFFKFLNSPSYVLITSLISTTTSTGVS